MHSVPTSNEPIPTLTVIADMKLIYLLPCSLLLACSSSKDLGENDPPLVIIEEAPSEIIVSEDDEKSGSPNQ